MVSEVSDSYFTHVIEKSIKYFKDLDLATYTGHKMSYFATDALRHIKIAQGSYTLTYQTGFSLIKRYVLKI